jgi:hypothetical protein
MSFAPHQLLAITTDILFCPHPLWRDKESEAPAGAQSRPPTSTKEQKEQSEAGTQNPQKVDKASPPFVAPSGAIPEPMQSADKTPWQTCREKLNCFVTTSG